MEIALFNREPAMYIMFEHTDLIQYHYYCGIKLSGHLITQRDSGKILIMFIIIIVGRYFEPVCAYESYGHRFFRVYARNRRV